MNLTPIDPDALPDILARFGRGFAPGSPAAGAFALIAETVRFRAECDTPAHRRAALALAESFGIPRIDAEPASAFSWDGRAIRSRSEASVLIHEVAHWLIAPPARRGLLDFGLGAGPETGRVADADAARCVADSEKEEEELLASLLGILWEAELGQPAVLAFVEQNWLEAWDRPAAAAQFRRAVGLLLARGLIGRDGRPCPAPGFPRVSAGV